MNISGKDYNQLSLRCTGGLQRVSVYLIEKVYIIVLYIISKTSRIEIGYKYFLATKMTFSRSVYKLMEHFFSFINMYIFLRSYGCVKSMHIPV